MIFLFSLCILVSWNLACKNLNSQKTNGLQIAASIFPVCDIVNQLVGDAGEAFFLVPAGANPHIYEPTPTDAKRLDKVDIFFGIHPEFDGWMQDYLPETAKTFYLFDVLEDHEESAHHTESHFESESQHDKERHHGNPHIWLSVKRVKILSQWIEKTLSELDVKNVDTYKKQRIQFQAALDSLDQDIKNRFRKLSRRKFIQWHPAWDYFADDYNLEILGTIEKGHGDSPSIQSFKLLIENARKYQTDTVVIGLYVENKSAETLAREIKGRLVRLDTMGHPKDLQRNSYIKLMRYNAQNLAGALSK